MNNLLSYCRLFDSKIRPSDKDLPVPAALHGHQLIVKYLYHHGTGFQGKTTTKMTQKIREMTAPMQIMQRMSEDYPM